MRVIVIKANEKDRERIRSSYSPSGEFINSFYFQGSGTNSRKLYYVTHGSREGYLILNSEKEDAVFSSKEFYFYMNGLLEFSDRANDIDEIVTIECYGGFHHKVELRLLEKTILMGPISTKKAVLWAGWRSKYDDDYFAILNASAKELYEIGRNKTGLPSFDPRGTDIRRVEEIAEYLQGRFAGVLFDEAMGEITQTTDYYEKEVLLS